MAKLDKGSWLLKVLSSSLWTLMTACWLLSWLVRRSVGLSYLPERAASNNSAPPSEHLFSSAARHLFSVAGYLGCPGASWACQEEKVCPPLRWKSCFSTWNCKLEIYQKKNKKYFPQPTFKSFISKTYFLSFSENWKAI